MKLVCRMNQQLPIESQLAKKLADNMNAEIVRFQIMIPVLLLKCSIGFGHDSLA